MKFPGNPTRSYRTREPVEVIGELVDWIGHSPISCRPCETPPRPETPGPRGHLRLAASGAHGRPSTLGDPSAATNMPGLPRSQRSSTESAICCAAWSAVMCVVSMTSASLCSQV
ncbi:NAD(+)--rifampin ADP-ribosyltransferase [Arthrobacter oryzae]|uniref:NAD(+)--rifampin ADP-ribosyltransferase n=1 Tax=Arthrobacter oryzae TaxID=409290 RepID=UPI00286A8642|nr:NAD(+)--rifampin ADP-ribosyltransferase [Arthrobacter oryzae]